MKSKAILLFALLTLGSASAAFGAAGTAAWLQRQVDGSVIIPGTAPTPSLTIKPSANVYFGWAVESGGTAYTIGTIHTSGTFTYATTSTDTNIYRFQNASNANASTSTTVYTGAAQLPPSSPADATNVISWGAGWTASK